MTKIKTRNYLLVILLLTTIVCGVIGGIAKNSKAFAEEDEYAGEIAPRYANNIYTYVNVNGAEVKVDFMGRDVLWPNGDRAQIRLSCLRYGDQVSYSYRLEFTMKPNNSKDPMHIYDRATNSGHLGANVDEKFYAETYTANGVKYSKWNLYQAKLNLTLYYNGGEFKDEFLIRFE